MWDTDATVDRLKNEATKRWGEHWLIDVTLWADGDFQAFALRSHGVNENGHLMRERLFILDSGEVAVDRITIEQEELIDEEIIEQPDSH